MKYLEKRDYLNSSKVRNEGNTEIERYNCGGYALNTFSWYSPHRNNILSRDEEVSGYIEAGYSTEEMYEEFLEEDLYQMEKDFPSLTLVEKDYNLKPGERLIAYRIYAITDDWGLPDGIDTDFHFRFKDYGENFWKEKMGSLPPRVLEDEDAFYWGDYDSDIIYFIIKI